jgi:hypothetical protein
MTKEIFTAARLPLVATSSKLAHLRGLIPPLLLRLAFLQRSNLLRSGKELNLYWSVSFL